jgi:UDP-N-acetylmuramoylalanine--D-glutamate ligase
VDDSIGTIPQATIAALRALSDRQITLLVGGYDRGLDQREFAEMIVRESPFSIITMPDTGRKLMKELRAICSRSPERDLIAIHEADDLNAAVSLARAITPVGGVVLLSPGAPSFNAYRNYAERGRAFAVAAGFDHAFLE